MDQLQRELRKLLRDVPRQLLVARIAEKVREQGIDLSERDLQRLAREILKRRSGTITLRAWKWWQRRSVRISFSDEEVEELGKQLERFADVQLPDIVARAIDDAAVQFKDHMRKGWAAELRRRNRDYAGFRDRLEQRWGSAVDLLALLVTMSREVGEVVNERVRATPPDAGPMVVEVLTRLHARSCQVAEEVICLLRAGYADGAMARWRTVHEIAVVSIFVHTHGHDAAVMYVDHQVVESLRAAEEYQKFAARMGYPAMEQAEIDALKAAGDAAVAKYGKPFASPYGWAASALASPRPTFADIERSIGIDHLRPHYRMSSHPVHANPKGVFFKLGLLTDLDVLLTGPSNAGLADPGHATAISLLQVIGPLVMLRPTMDNIMALKAMTALEDEIGATFLEAHKRLVADSAT